VSDHNEHACSVCGSLICRGGSTMDCLRVQIENLRAALAEMTSARDGLRAEIGRLEERYDTALAEVDGRLKAAKARGLKLARELEDAQNALAEKDAEIEKWKDCHSGPGTTEPACGACTTCLSREIERLKSECSTAVAGGIGIGSGERSTLKRALAASEAREKALREALVECLVEIEALATNSPKLAQLRDDARAALALSATDTAALEAACLRVALLAIELRREWVDGKKSPHECAQLAVRSVLGLPEKEER
jgi:hypothetical protein